MMSQARHVTHICSEDDSVPELPSSKVIGRRKTKIDHITVEFLLKRRCFDMPLAVSFSAHQLDTL